MLAVISNYITMHGHMNMKLEFRVSVYFVRCEAMFVV